MVENKIRTEVMHRLLDMVTDNKRELIEQLSALRTKHITVVLENIYQSHNASAVVRSCDCFGIQDVHVIADKKKYEVNREVAMGAGKWVTTHHYKDQNTASCLTELKKEGYRIIATSPYATKTLNDIEIDQPMALVFGTEKDGLSREAMNMADDTIKIPMYGFTESFNISVSAALILNTLRERLMKSSIPWQLSETELTELKIEWCRNILYKGQDVYKQVVQDVDTAYFKKI
jgi:tRNA (guanosine-2'-O-)-methyltransferase